MWKARLRGNRKKGMTLVEMMVSIGIIAVLVAIAIPSIIGMRRSLQFKKMNEYAKEVFLAAQNTLVERNAAGTLDVLRANPDDGTLPAGAAVVPEIDNANFPAEDWSAQYCYTVTGTDAFELLLPAGSIDETVRSQNILVEYNPYTGNVYSVFYSESNALNYSNVTRDKTLRRKAMLGYYAGSGLSGGDALRDLTQPVVDLTTKGQEAILTVSVPIPDNYLADAHTFANAMRVSALIEGELFGGKQEDGNGYWFEIPQDQFGVANVITGNTAQVSFVLDSLKDQGSFASLAQNNPTDAKARYLDEIKNVSDFKILPGDNVKITVSITIEGLSDVIEYSDVIVSGLNPMFGAVQEVIDTTGGTETVCYAVYLENGRHLQNLNAIAPQIADKVKSVYFSEDIYWNETQNYYTNKYVTQSAAAAAIAAGKSVAYENSKNELPGRGLPYFVPITSPNLFGSAYFASDSKTIIDLPFIGKWGVNVPVLTDTDTLAAEGAEVFGGDHKVLYLDIDAGKTSIVKDDYYAYKDASNTQIGHVGKDRFTGLFSYCESNISSLYVVNSSITGTNAAGTSATGGLVGACGPYAFLYDCGIYIDTEEDQYFSRINMPNYKVTGHNAVGGLVGYAKTHKSVGGGELSTNSEKVLAFSQCFAAVPVTGYMVTGDSGSEAYGYTNGVGGMVGVSIMSNFYNCYASGDVSAEGIYSPGLGQSIIGLVTDSVGCRSRGAGGFVGTSHGTRYTNCFTTGDVKGEVASGSHKKTGAGGFIGVTFLEEKFTYNNTVTLEQETKFRSCYTTGVSTVRSSEGDNLSETFCGRLLSFTGAWLENAIKAIENAFNIHVFNPGSYYTAGTYYFPSTDLPDFLTTEVKLKDIYKDSYYLNQYVAVADDQFSQSNICSEVVQYQDLQALNAYQLTKQSKAPNKSNNGYLLNLVEQVNNNHYSRRNDYLGAFDANDRSDNWDNPGETGFVTHPYSLNIGNTYPFTKLKGMDYYGDWPTYLPNLALAYYEEYEGETDKGYYLDRDRTSTLKNGKEGDKTYKVVGDGYAIMCSGNVTRVQIGKNEYKNPLDVLKTSYNRIIGNVSYNVYELKPSAIKQIKTDKEATDSDEFYTKLKITTDIKHEDTPATFTVYFNPDFALTQVNPNVANNGVQKHEASKPDSLPKQIYIRSARQLREIGLDAKYWGADYHYAQLVDIDADSYDWKTSLGLAEGQTVTFKPIGSVTAEGETAFQGSYNGGAGYVESARISNVDLDIAEDQLAYGLFGLIGETGSVSSVTVDVDKAPASTTETNPTTSIQLTTSVGNMGMLAGINRGEISAVTIAADNALTITAQEADPANDVKAATIGNFGMLAGLNNGSITGCTVSAAKPIQADVTGAMGGLVGVNAAAQSDSAVASAIDGCTVTIDTIENTNASTEGFTGGIVGKLEGGTFNAIVPTAPTEPTDPAAPTEPSEPTEPAEPVETTMPITIGNVTGKGYVGGFAGFASGSPGSIDAVQVTNVTGAAAGGVIGKAEDLTLSGSDVTVKGVIEGKTHAGGFAAQVTKSGSAASLKNCNVTLEGRVTATADDGTAAGFAAELNAAVMDSGVFCRGTDKVTIKGNKAAGFAGNAYLVRSSSFSGKASIEGKTYAAGFANEITMAQGNVVAPVLMDSQDLAGAFQNGKNADLIISAPNAAGFVNTVPEGADVRENAALGTITGANPAGFAGSNKGKISACMANVSLTSSNNGIGFVLDNKSEVEACYVWYVGDGVKYSFVSANTGDIRGCYAAPLGSAAAFTPAVTEDSTGTFANCYNVCAKEEDTETLFHNDAIWNVLFEEMSWISVQKLGGKELGWASVNVAKKYPYDKALSGMPYEFPMLQKVPQYGNWKNGPIYAYGVVYYEYYSKADGGEELYYRIEDLSDPQITEEDASLSVANLPDGEDAVNMVPTRTGYGVFYRNPAHITVEGDGKEWEDRVQLEMFTGEGFAAFKDYIFMAIGAENLSCVAEGKVIASRPVYTITGANDSAKVNPYFANAIKLDTSETSEPLHIHTPKQLQNVAGFPKEDFVICRNLDMSGSTGFVAIDKFSGSLTADHNAKITGFDGDALFGSVAKGAEISNLSLEGVDAGSLFGNVTDAKISNLTLTDITAGSLFGDVTGSTVTGLSLKDFEANGALFGTVDNSTIQGATVVKASVTIDGSGSSAGLFANSITGGSTIKECKILGEAQTAETQDANTAKRSTLTVTGGSAVGVLAGEAVDSTISEVQIQGVDLDCSGTAGADIGGIVGRMTGGSMTGCDAGTAVYNTLDAANDSTAHVGGAVGFADGADGKTAASYKNCSVAVDMEVSTSEAGQFVGYVAYGNFENCKGLQESNYLFLGGIKENTQNVEEGYYYYDGDPSKQTVTVTRNEADGSYPGFTSVTTLKEYNATLSKCTYLDVAGTEQTQKITSRSYYTLEKETGVATYKAEKLTIGYILEELDISGILEKIGEWTWTKQQIRNYCVKVEDNKYVEAYAWNEGSYRNPTHCVGYKVDNNRWPTYQKVWDDQNGGGAPLYVWSEPQLETGYQYLICKGSQALSGDAAEFVDLTLTVSEQLNLEDTFALDLNGTNKVILGEQTGIVTIDNDTYNIKIGETTSKDIQVYQLTPTGDSWTEGTFRQTEVFDYSIVPDPNLSTQSMDHVEAQFSLRPIVPEAAPTESESETTISETTVPGMTVPETTEGDTSPTSQSVGDPSESEIT